MGCNVGNMNNSLVLVGVFLEALVEVQVVVSVMGEEVHLQHNLSTHCHCSRVAS